MWIALGALLGVLSLVEERVDGFAAGISTDTTWCALAFACGSPRRGVFALTAANAAYYAAAWDLTYAGRWLTLGVVTGVVFGVLGGAFRRGRHVAVLPLAFVAASEIAGAAYLP